MDDIQYPIATYNFICPVTGEFVSKGESYAIVEGCKVSLEGLRKMEEED